MKNLMTRMWKHAVAVLLGLSVPTAAMAQQPPVQMPMAPLPPVQPGPIAPGPVPPGTMQPPLATPAPPALPNVQPPPGFQYSQPPGVQQTGGPVGAPTGLPNQAAPGAPATSMPATGYPNYLPVGTQPPPPILSSQPPPFMIGPDTPVATNDPNFFQGFPQVQDVLGGLTVGNYRNTRYKWYGFVRLDGIYDFRPIASTDMFVTSAIPVPQGRGQNFVMTPRYTRLGWDTETPIPWFDWTMRTRIEVDFFNGNTSGAFGSFPLRLRFAWADFGPFLIGQAASLFMDYDVYPNVLDYEGPGGNGTHAATGRRDPYPDRRTVQGRGRHRTTILGHPVVRGRRVEPEPW